MTRSRAIVIGLAAVLIVVAGAIWAGKHAARRFLYPTAVGMPPAVESSISEVIARLEAVLRAKAPHVLDSLRPGLADLQIADLEGRFGIALPEDIRALYKWHDGAVQTTNGTGDIIPWHQFTSLGEALEENKVIQADLRKATRLQRVTFGFFAGHRTSWVCLFSDGAGDGYFFDPKRKASEGAVFYNFSEDATYTFFPSIKNLLAAITKCYEEDVFYVKSGSSPPELEGNFERAQAIWKRYGSY